MFFSEILFKVKTFSEFIFGVVVYVFIEHNMLLCTCLDCYFIGTEILQDTDKFE